MNIELTSDQEALREAFARFLDEQSTMARVRAAQPVGFDADLWRGLADLGAFAVRVPADDGGLELSLLDAAALMEEAGRTLASGPLAETLVAARLLALAGGAQGAAELAKVLAGESVVSLAFHDIAARPLQWVAGGAVADAVLALRGDQLVLLRVAASDRKSEPNLASTPIAELDLAAATATALASGPDAVRAFGQALEEWKLLMSAALSGLAREAIRLASAYACERIAFGQPIGAYQALSHPLADLITEIEGGKLFLWKTLRDVADDAPRAGANISLSLWWNADVAARAGAQALQTFGGYGLTTEYDIHLYNLRALAWPLVVGDTSRLLEEAGRRLYAGEAASLPDAGEIAVEFDLGEDARAYAAEVDAFFERTLTPELRAKAHYSWDGHDPGVHRKLAEARMLFPAWRKELGGRDAKPYTVSAGRAAWEKHGWSGHASGTTQMVGALIDRFGSDELKAEVLSKIVSGEAICSLGYSEPGSGSDVFAAQVKATPEGNGWRIDGQKMFTSGANITDYVIMLTRTDPDLPKHKGVTMYIVPLKADGVTVQPVYTFQDERTNITYYDGVKIPDSYRLGEVNGGLKVMSAALELEHGATFAEHQAHMLEAAEELCREIRHDGRPLIEETQAQARLARVHVETEISELLGLRALWAKVENKSHMAFGPMAKMFSSETFLSGARDLLQLTAPLSLSKREGPAAFINQSYRHAHGTRIYAGTSQVHRSMIAERYLGLPRSRAA